MRLFAFSKLFEGLPGWRKALGTKSKYYDRTPAFVSRFVLKDESGLHEETFAHSEP